MYNYWQIFIDTIKSRKIQEFSSLTIKNLFNSKQQILKESESLMAGVDWLLESFRASGRRGFSRSYSLRKGWDKPYPETTGYIIPSLLNFVCYSDYRKKEVSDAIIDAGEWLLSIQNKNGSFSEPDNQNPIIFDTGQILFGLFALYKYTKENKYFRAVNEAANWLITTQEKNGSWKKYTSNFMNHSYHSRVSWALLEIDKKEEWRSIAVKNLDWVLTQQRENGWFENSYYIKSERSVLHFIAYVLRGLIECGLILEEDKYISCAQKTADMLINLNRSNQLRSYYDEKWKMKNKNFCLVGLSQVSIIFKELYCIYNEEKYFQEALKIDHFVTSKQIIDKKNKNINGAIPGSFPIWGTYQPLKLINWGVKFYIDSLLLSQQIKDRRNYIIYKG